VAASEGFLVPDFVMDDDAYRRWQLDKALDQLRALAARYNVYENYDLGFHPIMFSSQSFRNFYAEVMRRYRLNLCRPIVDAISERVSIDAWEGNDDAQTWWLERGLTIQNRLHRQTLRSGDGYVLVWPDGTMDGELRAHRILANEATVVYSDESETPEYGIKLWQQEIGRDRWVQRMNVYHLDRVERYVRPGTETVSYAQGSSFRWYEGDEAGPVIEYDGPIREQGQDGYLPLVHFAGTPDLTPFGTSVLEDVIPVQDALNKHAIDLLVTSESLALPLRALLGFEVVEGPDGKPTNLPDFDPRMDYLLTVPGEATKLIQLPSGDMSQLMRAKESAIDEMAAVAGIHSSRLRSVDSVPSGEALRVVERPLVSQVRNLQQDFGPSWAQVVRLLGYDAQPLWEDPTEMDITEVWSLVQQKVDAGWPARQAYVEAGLDPRRVDEVLAEAAATTSQVQRNLDAGMLL
jgi:hypothetical protein